MAEEKAKRPKHLFDGSKPGPGRPSKAEELGLNRLLDECWDDDQRRETIRSLVIKANGNDKQAIEATKLLLAYTYGKPKEYVQQEQSGVLEVRYVSDWRNEA